MKNSIILLRGDSRQEYFAKELTARGISVLDLNTQVADAESICQAITQAKAIVGPIPLSSKEGTISLTAQKSIPWEDFLQYLSPGQIFAAGCFPQPWKNAFMAKGISIYDYMQDLPLAEYNTIATAEGAIAEAITHSPYNLHQNSCAVVGYGKCGKTLAQKLKALGANTTVYTRNAAALARASVDGMEAKPLTELKNSAKDPLFFFSTAPALIFTEEILLQVNQNALLIDIASAPGSVDYSATKKLGIQARHCLGLPGKYAPASSAKMLVSSFLSYSKTVGVHF